MAADDPTIRDSPLRKLPPVDDARGVATVSGVEDPVLPGVPRPAPIGLPGARYADGGELLGEGGMGQVSTVDDRLIGRRVALKVLRSELADAPAMRAMFLREARVQGQLEHPAIVPVYDVGLDPSGAAYFTMKRVRGTTLSQLLEDVRKGRVPHQPRRLLTALSSVCLAVDFAHERGVVHRDLKPSNLMLGDFGEVHVLDWGVARVLRDEAEGDKVLRLPERSEPPSAAELGDRTRAAGTPGYMAPEQSIGVLVGPTADVFALGAILYEILTLRPLYSVSRQVDEPLQPTGALTAELAAICDRATELAVSERLPSARALHEQIERWLDGERTVELRRAAAAGHVQAAQARIADGSAEARRAALRELGRALALEPEDAEALGLLYRLLAEAPVAVPEEVQAELRAKQAAQQRLTARTSALGYASVFLFLPVLLWVGVRDWASLAAFFALGAAAAGVSYVDATRTDGGSRTYLVLLLSTACFSVAAAMYGPAILVPTMIATNTMAFALHLDARARRVAIAIGVAGVLAPFALAALQWVPGSYAFILGRMTIEPHMLALPRVPTLLFLAASAAVMVFTGTRSAGEVRDALAAAEARLLTQRWYLRQLAPERVSGRQV